MEIIEQENAVLIMVGETIFLASALQSTQTGFLGMYFGYRVTNYEMSDHDRNKGKGQTV